MQHSAVTRELITELAGTSTPGCCVTAYFPVSRPPADVRKNAIRAKNALRSARRQLAETAGGDSGHATLDAIGQVEVSECDWSERFSAVGVFADADDVRLVRLPNEADELVVTSDRFYLKPMLEALQLDIPFLVLSLSRGQVWLARGNSTGLVRVADDDWLPDSLADVMGHELSEPQLQHHAGARGSDATIYHGQGAGKDDTDAETTRFLRAVDEALCAHSTDDACVVLAGVDAVTSEFRRLSGYPALLAETVSGNSDERKTDELFAAAWPLVRSHRQDVRDRALSRVAEHAPEHVLDSVGDVVTAAADGRVDELFVAADAECWGRYDGDTRRIRISESREHGDEGLLDRAAIESFVRGGTVYPVSRQKLPDGCLALAALRY